MNSWFPEVKTKFGFGMMRLPMIDKEVDIPQVKEMVDRFMAAGFTYIDTAHVYLDGKSETAIRECIVERYPRESFTLTNKLSAGCFKTEADVLPYFNLMLEACGVEYFDFFLMHAQSRENYDHFRTCRAYEIGQELKQQGKIRHLGISFHDTADFLEQILTEHPEVELVQIQLNYLDYDDPSVQSRACLEVCQKFNKPVVVMEPVKGGMLADLPEECANVLQQLHGGSNASYAMRFAAGCPGVMMVLSGMSNVEQMEDNLKAMTDFRPVDERELEAIHQVVDYFKSLDLVACTGCRYCVPGCPKSILIPDLFNDLNSKVGRKDWMGNYLYHNVHTRDNGKASDCIKCGKCEKICPQHLPIREYMEKVSEAFDKAEEPEEA